MNDLPTITRDPQAISSTMISEVQTTVAIGPPQIQTLSISVPSLVLEEEGYCQRFVQLRLTEKQARKLRQIQIGLEERNAVLADERYVNSPLDAVRWMLENAK